MKTSARSFLISLVLIVFVLLCQGCNKSGEKDNFGTPVLKPDTILSSFNSYWNYTSKHVKLYQDYSALDTAGKVMEKGAFMKLLSSGEFLPLKRITSGSDVYYQLHRMGPSVSDEIRSVLHDWAYTEYGHYEREGKPLPGFNFTDLNGKEYDRESLKGKITVMKFWFIGCVPCVAEMPELNKLVARYKNRNDVVFVSLALDSKEKLAKFLQRVPFDYAVVAEQERYLTGQLNIRAYPTHLIIDKTGRVVKIVNHAREMIYVLDREASKK